jgi:hypothetical protein
MWEQDLLVHAPTIYSFGSWVLTDHGIVTWASILLDLRITSYCDNCGLLLNRRKTFAFRISSIVAVMSRPLTYVIAGYVDVRERRYGAYS